MLLYPQPVVYRLYHGILPRVRCFFYRKKVLIEVMKLNIKTNQGIEIGSMDEILMRILDEIGRSI